MRSRRARANEVRERERAGQRDASLLPCARELPRRGARRSGPTTQFALANLQERGTMFVPPGTEVYEGMIVGENSRSDDMDINPTKEKKLTNMRQSSGDILVPLIPHKQLSLEQALEFCREDECVEITPGTVRIRKVLLSQTDRVRAGRKSKD
jgi:GTP-binding protein